jgi:hypothetical protein
MNKSIIETVTLTPKMAIELLGATDKGGLTLQRRRKAASQADILRAMDEGDWLSIDIYPEGSTSYVRLPDGVVIQGRNRLEVVSRMESSFSIPWRLVFVDETEAGGILKAQLCGSPKWSSADLIGANYPIKDPMRFAAMMRTVKWLDSGSYGAALTAKDVEAMMSTYKGSIQWAMDAVTKVVPAPISGAFAWGHTRASFRTKGLLSNFVEQVRTGFEIKEGDPAALIRTQFVTVRNVGGATKGGRRIASSTHQVDRWEGAVLTIRLMEAMLRGEKLTRKPTIGRDNVNALIARVDKLLRAK